MQLLDLTTFQFRNLADQKLEFHPKLNIFVGLNGQGKTNLVEGLAVLSNGRSFRTSSSKELIALGEQNASLFGTVSEGESSDTVGIVLGGRDGKQYYHAGQLVDSLEDYLGRIICISFSPSDLALIKGAPLLRRKFLDKIIVELNPAMLSVYAYYQRALHNKQALLKSSAGVSPRDVEPWNTILAVHGAKIIYERKRVVREFVDELSISTQVIAPSDGSIAMTLESECPPEMEGEEEILSILKSRLEHALGGELTHRTAKVGPHRDDLVLYLGGKDMRAFASQGQTRSLVLELKMVSIGLIERIKKVRPIVLLDDMDSELDENRLARLFKLLISPDRQTFLTGTKIPDFIRNTVSERFDFAVENGRISR